MDERVMVFAPLPQLTVTIEQLRDRTELHLHAGGQGLWQARMLRVLDVQVMFCATLGGEVGRALEPLIEAEDVQLRAVRRAAESGWYVHDRRDGGDRSVVADDHGEPLGRHEMDELYTAALAEGLRSGMSLLSGPGDPSLVDPNAYRRLATDLSNNGCRVAADLTGDHLDAVLEGRPAFVKVSDEEIGDRAPAEALHKLHAGGAELVVVSRAHKPALAYVDDEVVEVAVPRLSVADHHGAGDSMTAGIVAVLARGGDPRESLKVGAAAGALNVTRHGLGTGRADAIAELAKHIELRPVDEDG
jgi:1-phosphofructokinase